MTDTTIGKTPTSFIYVIGLLADPPRIRQRGKAATFVLRQPDDSHIFVRVLNPARVMTVETWEVGDFIVVTGNLRSQYDTKLRRQMMYVYAINFFRMNAISEEAWEKISAELWEESGLPSFLSLAGVFLKLTSEQEAE